MTISLKKDAHVDIEIEAIKREIHREKLLPYKIKKKQKKAKSVQLNQRLATM